MMSATNKPEFQVGDIIAEIGGDTRKWVVTYVSGVIYWVEDLSVRHTPTLLLSRERGDRDFMKVSRARFVRKGADGQ